MRLDADQSEVVQKVIDMYEVPIERRGDGGAVICVQAVAGAGKSTLITDITRRVSNARYLFLCHTDNIADRARATLPSNVSVATFAQAAHRFVCKTHSEKVVADTPLSRSISNRELVNATGGFATEDDAYQLRRVLDLFYASSHRNVEAQHVRAVIGENAAKTDVSSLLGLARDIWASQTRRAADTAPLTERAAIKLWTMGRNFVNYNEDKDAQKREGEETPRMISPLGDQDICIVEEAQDLYESIISFLGRQRCVVLMFSDDMQSLGRHAPFRKQDHALQQRGHGFSINTSYRFGGELPAVLTCMREKEAGKSVVLTTGKGQTSIYMNQPEVLSNWLDKGLPFTAIASQATSLYDMSLMYSRARIGWVNSLASPEYLFDLLLSLICLATEFDPQRHAKRPRAYMKVGWLQKFNRLEEAHDRFQRIGDLRSSRLCQWIWGREDYDLLNHFLRLQHDEMLYQQQLLSHRHCDAPDITFSSVRAAKGHEWPLVAVSNDMITTNVTSEWAAPDNNARCAIRWVYTAASRAQHGVALPVPLLEHLAEHGHLIQIDTKPPVLPNAEVVHPHFGVERHRQLEMSPANRAQRQTNMLALQKQAQKGNRSSRTSGQLRTKARIDKDADALRSEGKSAQDFIKMMRKR